MAQALHHSHFVEAGALRSIAAAVAQPFQRLFGGLYDALLEANQRKAQRDIERLVSTRGKFTDSVERDISNILLGDGWNQRR